MAVNRNRSAGMVSVISSVYVRALGHQFKKKKKSDELTVSRKPLLCGQLTNCD